MQDSVSQQLVKFRGRRSKERNGLLARFCSVQYDTAARWGEQRLPIGTKLIKLWFFLEAHGLEISELEKIHSTIRYIGELLAFGVISEGEARELLDSKSHSHLWVILQGKFTPLVVKKNILTREKLVSEYGDSLVSARHVLAEQGLIPAYSMSAAEVPDPPPQRYEAGNSLDIVIALAASNISGLKPLLTIVMRDLASAETLREIVGSETYHDVLDLLKSGASRKAHDFYHGKERER